MNEIYLMEYLPLVFMGFLCGFVRFSRNENVLINEQENENTTKLTRTRFLRVIDVVLTSVISAIIVFECLGHFTEFTYLVKISISAAIALYGVDKILEIIHKVWELRSSK